MSGSSFLARRSMSPNLLANWPLHQTAAVLGECGLLELMRLGPPIARPQVSGTALDRRIPMPAICYLCGSTIESDHSMDHLPPKQFYASSLRTDLNLSKLVTIPAHGACNRSFEKDEEYFTWSLSPLAVGSTAGDALARERAEKVGRGRSVPLFQAIRQEFDKNPSGLHLPGGRVVKRFEGKRVNRVAWKLVRGMYFHETSAVLPDDTPFTTEIIEPERARELAGTNPLWEKVKSQDPRGSYGGVFEYKYFVDEIDGKKLHSWGIILWDKIMIFVAHHDPGEPPNPEETS